MVFFDALRGVVAALLIAATPVTAQTPISEEDNAALNQASRLGELLYRYDQAAWHTTDVFVEQVSDPGAKGYRGWVINSVEDGSSDTLEVVFFRATDAGFVAGWSAQYDGNEVSQTRTYERDERPLTEQERAKAEAIQLARRTEMNRCSDQSFNSVVVPTGKGDGGLYVYFLTPQPELNIIPFGGHHRHEVVGGEIIASRGFTNSCLNIPIVTQESKGRPAALTVSHVLDPTPTEIHVFSTFVAKVPIYVVTIENDRVWASEITEGKSRVRFLQNMQ